MSIRTNPMKAVPSLQKRLSKVTTVDKKWEDLKTELSDIKNLFQTVKQREEELLDTLTVVDGLLRNFSIDGFKSHDDIVDRIRESARKLQPADANQIDKTKAPSLSGQKSKDVEEQDRGKEVHRQLSLSQDKNELVGRVLRSIQVSYEHLNVQSRLCMLSLSVFPENEVIKKRHTIYWWIGEGFVEKTKDKTTEEVGEDVFEELLDCDLIVPHGNGKCPVVNKFKINPWIRHMLVSSVLRKDDQIFGFYSQIITSPAQDATSSRHVCLVLDQEKVNMRDKDRFENLRTVFNVGARYLSFGSQWLAGMKKLVVLQLGRWQDSAYHHIEVKSGDFLRDLKAQKHLKYLSLRGISRISELPSIVQLASLEILDLKACHNLETLPIDIASLKRLTHLDVSQCYLLESMPKGIEKLTELEVLKGFVIGISSRTPCRISDLAKLKKLKRLSIHIGSEAVIQDAEFESLKELSAVKRLKISWGVSSTRYKAIQKHSFSFPAGLEKLDLEGLPEENIPEWLKPSKLPSGLKKLYIEGGKLKKLDHGEGSGQKWAVEIVRVKYLKALMKIEKQELKKLFPSLKYGYVQILEEPVPFEIEWSIEE